MSEAVYEWTDWTDFSWALLRMRGTKEVKVKQNYRQNHGAKWSRQFSGISRLLFPAPPWSRS